MVRVLLVALAWTAPAALALGAPTDPAAGDATLKPTPPSTARLEDKIAREAGRRADEAARHAGREADEKLRHWLRQEEKAEHRGIEKAEAAAKEQVDHMRAEQHAAQKEMDRIERGGSHSHGGGEAISIPALAMDRDVILASAASDPDQKPLTAHKKDELERDEARTADEEHRHHLRELDKQARREARKADEVQRRQPREEAAARQSPSGGKPEEDMPVEVALEAAELAAEVPEAVDTKDYTVFRMVERCAMVVVPFTVVAMISFQRSRRPQNLNLYAGLLGGHDKAAAPEYYSVADSA